MKKAILKIIVVLLAIGLSMLFVKAVWTSDLPEWLKIWFIAG